MNGSDLPPAETVTLLVHKEEIDSSQWSSPRDIEVSNARDFESDDDIVFSDWISAKDVESPRAEDVDATKNIKLPPGPAESRNEVYSPPWISAEDVESPRAKDVDATWDIQLPPGPAESGNEVDSPLWISAEDVESPRAKDVESQVDSSLWISAEDIVSGSHRAKDVECQVDASLSTSGVRVLPLPAETVSLLVEERQTGSSDSVSAHDSCSEIKSRNLEGVSRKQDGCRRLSEIDLEIKFRESVRGAASSPSLDTKAVSRKAFKRRHHVSATVMERMQQDPVLAEHFAGLETPIMEPIQDARGSSRRTLRSTSRLKRTTDAVGTKYMNEYIVIKLLGRGTFGKVKLCLNTMDCKLYAVKIVHRKWATRRSVGGTRDDVGKGAMREIAIMKKLNHPNVVALHEVIDDPSKRKLYLVLEYVEGGPIMDNDMCHPIPEDKARLYFRDMCQGLDYLHFNKIIHRDLKPGNLLQTMDGRVKISDFGVSHMFDQESDSIPDTAGTPAFLAPEICTGGKCQGRAADIWALGVCLYVMVCGEIPFPAETVVDMYQCIVEKKETTGGVPLKNQSFKEFEGFADSCPDKGPGFENTSGKYYTA